MAYLSYTEYLEIMGTDETTEETTEEEFNKLLSRASDLLDIQTRSFYQFNDLEADIEFRKSKFKKAVAYQIEYMYVTGALNSYEVNTPQSWSIGRTSVTDASRYSNTGQNEAPSIISDDAINVLSGTGLLYRGVSR